MTRLVLADQQYFVTADSKSNSRKPSECQIPAAAKKPVAATLLAVGQIRLFRAADPNRLKGTNGTIRD
jgi:hypothetical protein